MCALWHCCAQEAFDRVANFLGRGRKEARHKDLFSRKKRETNPATIVLVA
jgi:hypothetical protein